MRERNPNEICAKCDLAMPECQCAFPCPINPEREQISEEWLKLVGFKWHEFDRSGTKHWLLWLGNACRGVDDHWVDNEDIGIEVSAGTSHGSTWFCWFRSDCSHRYARFVHVRHLRYRDDLVRMIEGITGQDWDPANNIYGSMQTPKQAERIRAEQTRADLRMLESNAKWRETEEDDSRGRPLVDHMQAAIDAGKAK